MILTELLSEGKQVSGWHSNMYGTCSLSAKAAWQAQRPRGQDVQRGNQALYSLIAQAVDVFMFSHEQNQPLQGMDPKAPTPKKPGGRGLPYEAHRSYHSHDGPHGPGGADPYGDPGSLCSGARR